MSGVWRCVSGSGFCLWASDAHAGPHRVPLLCRTTVHFQSLLQLDLRVSSCYEVLIDDIVLLLFF